MQETAREVPRGKVRPRATHLPFASIPHQSRLFLDYQSDPLSLRNFFPNAVERPLDVASLVPAVLAGYTTDRNALSAALLEINTSAGSSDAAMENIERLRDPECVAVLTGQQAGLFSGPLYTIYKALSVVRMARSLNEKGIKSVPVFWAATEDHDFDEVAHAAAIGGESEVFEARYSLSDQAAGCPVGDVVIDDRMSDVVTRFFGKMNSSEFTNALRARLLDHWTLGEKFGNAFLKTLADLFKDYGLVLVDPMHLSLKRLASPIYQAAINGADAITESLAKREGELAEAGYHSQVRVDADHFPLFWIDENGQRNSIRKTGSGAFVAKRARTEFSKADLQDIAMNNPERLSPGVMLRPVVQDFLFPTICYFGGSAEIAYFAQNSAVYGALDRHVTTIIHRQSFTIVEPKHRRALKRFDLHLTDLFDGLEKVTLRLGEAEDRRGSQILFAEVEERINAELDRLDRALSNIDQTVAQNLATRRRKIIYHIASLRQKAALAAARNDHRMMRQINALFTNIMPGGEVQERYLNVFSYLNKYGPNFIGWLYDATEIDNRDHVILDL